MQQKKIEKTKPIDLETLLRNNNFVIRNNSDFNALQELEALRNCGLDIGKIYPAKARGVKLRLKM
jgi:hypothetical protein